MEPSRQLFRLLYHMDGVLTRLNSLLSVVYISLVTLLITLTGFVYMRHLHPLLHATLPPLPYALHTTVFLYLFFSVSTNYVFCVLTCAGRPILDTESGTGSPFPAACSDDLDALRTRSETWRWCSVCRATKPPRAHHCSACNACFHRLCHHCPAVGRCVGRDNYPFFFRFVMCAWAGALLVASSAAWLAKRGGATGKGTRDVLFFTGVAASAVAVAVGVLGGWHVYLLGTGQTTIEWLENVQMRRMGKAAAEWGRWGGPFSRGMRGNVKEAFGEIASGVLPWWAVLFLPVKRIECTAKL